MTLQEIYNKVKAHLLTQNTRSKGYVPRDNKIGCAYRGDYGLKCAVGCLITDEAYGTFLEGRAPTSPVVAQALAKSGVIEYDPAAISCDRYRTREIDLMCDLQMVHDSHNPDEWAAALRSTAYNYKLEP